MGMAPLHRPARGRESLPARHRGASPRAAPAAARSRGQARGGDRRYDAHDERQEKQHQGQRRGHDDRQGRIRRRRDDQQADGGGKTEPDEGTDQRLADDDLVDVGARGAYGSQCRELVDVILGAGIKRLGDNDGAHDHARQCAREQGEPGAGAEQPEGAAAVAKLGGCEHVDIGQIRLEPATHALNLGAGCDAHEKVRRLVRRHSGEGACAIERGEDVRRGGERADAAGDGSHLHLLAADFGVRADAVDAEPVEIRPVDRDGARNAVKISSVSSVSVSIAV